MYRHEQEISKVRESESYKNYRATNGYVYMLTIDTELDRLQQQGILDPATITIVWGAITRALAETVRRRGN